MLFYRSYKTFFYPEINFPILIEKNENFIIFDGTAVINRIPIQKQKCIIKTCREFAYLFSKIVLKESEGFPVVLALFDRYL